MTVDPQHERKYRQDTLTIMLHQHIMIIDKTFSDDTTDNDSCIDNFVDWYINHDCTGGCSWDYVNETKKSHININRHAIESFVIKRGYSTIDFGEIISIE